MIEHWRNVSKPHRAEAFLKGLPIIILLTILFLFLR
jgi:hypothetical protein